MISQSVLAIARLDLLFALFAREMRPRLTLQSGHATAKKNQTSSPHACMLAPHLEKREGGSGQPLEATSLTFKRYDHF